MRAVVRAIVTDIEGTTSSLAFVRDVLFPYASARLADFVRRRGEEPEVRAVLDEARAAATGDDAAGPRTGERLDDAELVATLQRWIVEDRKVAPLKSLQGLLWEEGYARRHLQGHVHDDAARALDRWHREGIALYVYSSGSERAQRLLFGHAAQGDLTSLFAGYFDTRVGPKRDVASYMTISEAIRRQVSCAPGDVLFLSDVREELDAARAAGMQTCCLRRPGEPADPVGEHAAVATFDELCIELAPAHAP